MGIHALACVKCGAPLTAESVRTGLATCPFCQFVMVIDSPEARHAPVAAPSAAASAQKATTASEQDRKALSEELAACAKAGGDLFATLRDGLRLHLRRDTDGAALACATFAIIDDFARENGVDDARRDPTVVSRVAQAVISSTYVLATANENEINLPFLAVGSAGPVHLQRRITESDLAALAKRQPASPALPLASPALQKNAEPPPKKKRGWFPF